MAINTTYDPTSTAQALAEQFVSGRQTMLTNQTNAAAAAAKGLSTLGSAISSFQSALLGLTGANKTIAANSAVFSDTSAATATATAAAATGSYTFFVERVATAHKVSYSGLTDFAGSGSLTLGSGSNAFTLDLSSKSTWTVRDLAAAINGDTNNTNISASVITTGSGVSELVLTAKNTGESNAITLKPSDPANAADAALVAKFGTANELTKAQDAVLRVGSEGGTAITQPGNTFNVIDGVTMTLTKAQAAGSTPLTLTVAADSSKTTANAQAFVDAYNKLKSALDALVNPADPASGSQAGAFAGDSGVRALRDRLVSIVRNTGSSTLAGFGITGGRDGLLSLDSTRLTKALAANPKGLDSLIGSTATGNASGISAQLDSYLKTWSSSVNGQIQSRKAAVSKLQGELATRQTTLDRQYDSAYARYLAQFTQLQSVQSSMSYNTSLFDALFSSSKD